MPSHPVASFAILHLALRIAMAPRGALGAWRSPSTRHAYLALARDPFGAAIALADSTSAPIVDRNKVTIHPRPRYAPPWLNFFNAS
jgi:hypothetical protein